MSRVICNATDCKHYRPSNSAVVGVCKAKRVNVSRICGHRICITYRRDSEGGGERHEGK